MTMALAKRIVLKWRTGTDSKMAEDYKWYCPLCDRVYERQTGAQLCCMERKEQPYWFEEGMKPKHFPVGVRHRGEYVPFESNSLTDEKTVSGDVIVFATKPGYQGRIQHVLIPKRQQRDYVTSLVSTFCYIDTEFEEWWETVKQDYTPGTELGAAEMGRSHNLIWNRLIKWIDRYLELKTVPEHHVICMIQTRQQYSDFTIEDISYTLKTLGEKANHMYNAERDHFPGPLKKYYDRAMSSLVWEVATFIQDGSFIDLVTRVLELWGGTPDA